VTRRVAGALELGGTHVASARVAVGERGPSISARHRSAIAPDAARDDLLAAITGTAVAVADPHVSRWGVATPGPFDYERGICTIRGVDKLEALYGADLRAILAGALGIADPSRVRFLNDADAFLLGEWWAGAARGHRTAIGVTLGTGLGSAFARDGVIVLTGAGVPADGRLDLVPFRGGMVEDVISRRGVLAAYARPGIDVAEIAKRARGGEARARAVFADLGVALGEFLASWIEAFAPSCLVFGGSITRAWDLFGSELMRECAPAARLAYVGPAERLDDAPLLGAALHALR
jgi:glucokinase